MIARKRLNKVSIIIAVFCCFLFVMGFLSGCGETNPDVNPPNEQEEQTEQIKVEITKDNISNYITFNIFNELVGTRPDPYYTSPNIERVIYTYHTTITVRSKNTNYEFENIEIKFGPKIYTIVPELCDLVFITVELDNKGNGYYEASLEICERHVISNKTYGAKSVSDVLPKIIRSVNDGVDNKGYVYIKQN